MLFDVSKTMGIHVLFERDSGNICFEIHALFENYSKTLGIHDDSCFKNIGNPCTFLNGIPEKDVWR